MNVFKRSRPDSTNAPSPSRWKRRLLGVFLALLLLVVVSPILVARTPLRNGIAALVLRQLQGDIRIGGASLGWFTAPVFTDLEVRDIAGRTLLRAPRIEGSKSLIALLCNPVDLGEFRLTQPALHIVCSGDSTNLETALAYWLQTTDKPDSGPTVEGIAVHAECTGASLLIQDEDTGREWTLDPVDIAVAVPHDRRTPLQFKMNAAVMEGRLNAELAAHLVETADGKPSIRAAGELHATEVPLAIAEPFLRRFASQIKLDGRLNANLTLCESDGKAGSPDARLQGSVSATALTVADPLLGPDILRLARVEMPCRLALHGSRLSIEQAEIQSEVGKASLTGTIDLAKNLRDTLYLPGNRVEAQVNLARLAGLVPNALHLTKDTQITSGTLSLHVRSSLQAESVRWEGDLRTSDLRGMYQGQRITWKEPFAVVFAARQEANALPVLERFRCDADFLRLDLSGSLDEWTARGRFNLGKLSEHLAGFVDLGPLRLRGKGTVRVTARRNPRGGHRLEGDIQLARLSLSDGGDRPWHEDSITVRLDVVGAAARGVYRLNAGGLHILAGKDGIDLDLLEPIADMKALRIASARVRVHGDLTRWHGRLRNLTGALEGMRMAGQMEVDGRLRYQPEAVQLGDIKVVGHGVRLQGFGFALNEPTLDFTTSGRWIMEKETLELQQTRLSCPTLTVQTPSLSAGMDQAGAVQITTSATVQGDVARLRRCLLTPPNTPDMLGGALAGRIDLRPDNGCQVVQLDLNIQNVVFGSPATPAWREPRIHVTGHGVYDLLKDSFRIVHLSADSTTLNGDAAGQITALSGDMELSLDGKLGYDLEKLEPQLRPYLGQSVKLFGRDARPFHIAGALVGPTSLFHRLHGEAGLNWQTLQAMGCQVGPADLRAQLTEGLLRTAPIEATLNQGHLRLEPSLRLDPGPLVVNLAKGRAIDRARLTPAACASGLGYALPIVANVAQAEGEFSLDLDSGRLPLSDPTRAEMAGRLIIHSAQVSGGPLVQELSTLLKGPATLTLTKDNVVSFQVKNGRIYHSGLELHFPELTVRTSGSVGMDGSLSLVAEMPVPPKWLGSSKLARAVAGQTIRLPIAGTLSQPKLDREALRAASARFAQQATENAIRQEVGGKLRKEAEKGLKNLFR